MDKSFYAHVKAFLLSHQIGEDPKKNLAKIKVIANTNPSGWDGKIPAAGIKVDEAFCKVAEAVKGRPVQPWWWYARQHEAVPSVVEDIYKGVSFDFAVVYPKDNAFVYVCVEPPDRLLPLLGRQDQLRAFILISLINKKFPKSQRENKRLRLGTVMGSKDMGKIYTIAAFKDDDARCRAFVGKVPVLTRLVHTASNTANWSVRLPGDKRIYGSLRDMIDAR
jgi:hypothetical protein